MEFNHNVTMCLFFLRLVTSLGLHIENSPLAGAVQTTWWMGAGSRNRGRKTWPGHASKKLRGNMGELNDYDKTLRF